MTNPPAHYKKVVVNTLAGPPVEIGEPIEAGRNPASSEGVSR